MKILSERAKNRLKIAARFLRQDGHRFEGANFYESVMNVIESLPTDRKLKLRELVDWVEAYGLAEQENQDVGTPQHVRQDSYA